MQLQENCEMNKNKMKEIFTQQFRYYKKYKIKKQTSENFKKYNFLLLLIFCLNNNKKIEFL